MASTLVAMPAIIRCALDRNHSCLYTMTARIQGYPWEACCVEIRAWLR